MRSRNDAALYSGSTSASYVKQKQQERVEKKLSQKTELLSVAPVVFDEINKAKEELGELLLAIVSGDDNDEEVMIKLSAVRLHRTWIMQLESKLKIVLRAKPLSKKKEQTND